MDKKLFDIPVLLIAFNRPETTCLVFEQIRKLRPAHLYLFSDAPRKDVFEDEELVETCRYLLDDSQIDWECKVERWYPESNMGCALGISSAITWAFETSEQLIILEDDCLPQPAFFTFCKTMLDMYGANDRIMHVSGTLRNEELKDSGSDHFFSLIGNTGGWATWKRAWNKYDFWMERLPEMKSQKQIQRMIRDTETLKYWYARLDQVYNDDRKQHWEVQWQYTLFKNYGLAVVPTTNFINNIGYMAPMLAHEIVNYPMVATKGIQSNEVVVAKGFEKEHFQMLVPKKLSVGARIYYKFANLFRLATS
jgi:hypothetical protein